MKFDYSNMKQGYLMDSKSFQERYCGEDSIFWDEQDGWMSLEEFREANKKSLFKKNIQFETKYFSFELTPFRWGAGLDFGYAPGYGLGFSLWVGPVFINFGPR